MSLKCCNRVCQLIEEVDLRDVIGKTHRLLIVGRCRNPKCGALRAQILYYDTTQKRFVYETIKSSNVKRTIEELKNNPFYTIEKDKRGSFQNQNWIFGQTKYKQEKEGVFIEHWACNFNGEKRLVERKSL